MQASDKRSFGIEWKSFYFENCDALFQTALLITSDPQAAEAALAGSLDKLDTSEPPSASSFATWEKTVAACSSRASGNSSPTARLLAQSMLQPELQAILAIDRSPRISFVLRMLLNYPASLSAKMIGVEEDSIASLLRSAFAQLCGKS